MKTRPLLLPIGQLVFAIFFATSFGSAAMAAGSDLSLKLELELKLQEKIKALVAPLDPHAQVVANIKLKSISADLPGTGMHVNQFLSTSEITQVAPSDIELVEIKVISRVEPFPDSLKELIEKSGNLPHIKTQFEYQKMDSISMEAIDSRESVDFDAKKTGMTPRNPQQAFLAQLRDFNERETKNSNTTFILCAVICALVITSAFALIITIKNSGLRISANLTQLKESSTSEMGQGEKNSSALPAAAIADPRSISDRSSIADSDRNLIPSFSKFTVVSLLSDCYWCLEDAYAAWLWRSLSITQKEEVIAQWPLAADYISSEVFSGEVGTKGQSYHLHPYYLKPQALENLSNDDVLQWIKKNPGSWNLLSPMRQSHLSLSLMEKIRLAKDKSKVQAPSALPSSSQQWRKLSQALPISTLSENDELDIYHDPSQVPENLRPQIKSLVWLALLSGPTRSMILGKITAQQLAQAWVGPEKILSLIEKDIDPKKLQLLKDYRANGSADRNSLAMSYIVQESLRHLPESSKNARAA